MKKALALTLIMALLLSALSGTPFVRLVVANFTQPAPPQIPSIYIRSNGSKSIEFQELPIQQVEDVYTLTGNIVNYSIVVQQSNIVINGAGYSIHGIRGWTGVGINLTGVRNVIVKNLRIEEFQQGIDLYQSLNNSIVGNNIINNGDGIRIASSSYNCIFRNNIIGYGYGIYMEPFNVGGFNNIAENNIFRNYEGIMVRGYNNSIVNNNITSSKYIGVFMDDADYSTFIGNNISNNGFGVSPDDGRGILLKTFSSANVFHHNNFINNAEFILRTTNTWDDGKEGNYWGNYGGRDEDGNGIGDTPYVINAKNKDNYPLTAPHRIENNMITLPSPAPKATETPEPFPIVYSMGFVAAIVLVLLSATVYIFKRKS